MGNKYWVTGGTGNWNSTSNWSDTDGGSSGATVPTGTDDVFVNGNSGSGNIALNASVTVHSLDFTASASRSVTGSNTVAIGGTTLNTAAAVFKLVSGITWSASGTNTIDNRSGGTTITTGGVALPSVTIASTNTAAVVFADSFSINQNAGSTLTTNGSGGITLTSGITATLSRMIVNGTAGITYSGVTINCNSTTGAPISFNTAPTLTGNGSSQLNATGWTSGALAFTTASFPGTVTITTAGNANGLTQSGAATFTNYTLNGAAAAQTSNKILLPTFTVSSALVIAGASARQRLALFNAAGSLPTGQITITCNGTATISNVDFQGIKTAGSAGTWSGTSVGSGGDVTGITATSPVSVYWVGGNSGNWNDANKWATSSGGSPGSAGSPLPNDTAVFDTNSISAGSSTIVVDSLFVGALTSTVAQTAFTLSYASALPLCFRDDITLSSTTTINATNSVVFRWLKDTGTLTITPNGGVFSMGAQVSGAILRSVFYSTTTVVGASTWTNIYIEANTGTFDISSGNLDAWAFLVGLSTTIVTFGEYYYTFRADISSAGAGFLSSNAGASKVTIPAGCQIKLTSANSTFNTGTSVTVDVLDLTGITSGTVTCSGSSKVNVLALAPGVTLTLQSSNTLTIKQLEAIGKSGSVITLNASSIGTAATLSCVAGMVNCDWLSVKDSTASGGATFYAGANSTSVSGNTGWSFASGPARQQLAMAGCGGW